MSERVLVTGGAGYIGSITAKELVKSGYDVVVVDNLENGHKEAVIPDAKLEVANVGNIEKMIEILNRYRPNAIIDFAAFITVSESMENPKKYFENNVANFINLLDAMVAAHCKFIIKSSTAAVYGNPLNQSDFPLNESYIESFRPEKSNLLSGIFNETEISGEKFLQKFLSLYNVFTIKRPELKLTPEEITKLRIPTSIYGVSKLLDEIVMKKYDNMFGIKYTALRYFNVAGADEDGDMGEDHPFETHLIPAIIKSIIKNTSFRVNGNDYETKDGTAIRDYIHVIDLAKAHLLALSYLMKNEKSEIFNLGNNDGYSVLEIVKTIEQVIDKKLAYSFGPRRQGDPGKLLASASKASDALNWQARFSLNDMISAAWKWHSSHPDGY